MLRRPDHVEVEFDQARRGSKTEACLEYETATRGEPVGHACLPVAMGSQVHDVVGADGMNLFMFFPPFVRSRV
ncbi:hypothetical protein MRB53_038290 [Persea americana]|nr:hypothetical protein MRB53_038290 [Persea americana]